MRDASPVYSFPSEPEKKSAWDEQPKEPKIALRDVEDVAAKRRTALIREHMGKPGSLGLCPLLEAQRLKYGIPDGAFRSQASFDRIYVFPLDLFEGDEKFGGTSIFKPALTKMKDLQEGHRGVLISAGLIALDRLRSHGIDLGHIVSTNKNVPFARRCERLEGFDIFYLVMRDADLAGSETLCEELLAGTKKIVLDDDGRHQLQSVTQTTQKQPVQVEDCW